MSDSTIPIFARYKRPYDRSSMSFFQNLFSKNVGINLVAALLVAVMLVWGSFAYLDHYTCHGCAITVPDLKGYQVDMIADITSKKDLRYVVLDSIYDENSERGAVVDQDPAPGAKVKENRRIYVIINRLERESVEMEDVTNGSPRQAIAMLKAMGLKVGELITKPSPYTDLVLEQLYKGEPIGPGTIIKKGEKITLVVASGVGGEKTHVPSLLGYNLNEAKTMLLERSLNLGAIICKNCETTDDTLTLSRIWKQRPIHNEKSLVNLGSYIDIWLTTDTAVVTMPEENAADENKDEDGSDE